MIIEDNDAPDRMTVFMVPVATWSGGVSDSMMGIASICERIDAKPRQFCTSVVSLR
jgi:hypothetical protein